jgi:SAM-dependent methyltransferase
MKKDYVLVTKAEACLEESDFVERFWTQQWEQSRVQTGQWNSVEKREEYWIMRPYLHRLQPGSHVLDGGCGLGEWTVFLTSLGFHTVGLDISRQTIAKLATLFPDLEFRCGDICKLDYPDDYFDAYFSWGVFEHFEQGLGVGITEAHRVLKPGGILFFSVPFQNWRHIFRDSRAVYKWDENCKRIDGYSDPMRFYQWRLTRPELWREISMRAFKVYHIHSIHKGDGLSRMLQLDLKLERGTLAYRLLLRLFKKIMPASWVAHMILAVAKKEPN